jgi:aspartate racemase
MKCIGLFGGLGVGAAIHYYDALARAREATDRRLELTMVHAQMSRVFEHAQADDKAGLASYLAGIIGRLKASGAEVAVIPAVTPHLCITELEAISSLPIVNLLTAARAAIAARGLRRVALFGTRFVVQTGMCGALRDIELVTLQPDELNLVHTTYTQLARSGRASSEQHRSLTQLAQMLCTRDRAEAIVLAGTDLTLLFNETNTDFPYVDCAAAHIQAVVRSAFQDA